MTARAPLAATHWAPCGSTGWTVRFYLLPGRSFPQFDLFAFARCLALSSKQVRAAGVRGVRSVPARNKNGEVHPAWIAPPAAAAALLAKARELGRADADRVEAEFAAAWHEAAAKMAKEKEKEAA